MRTITADNPPLWEEIDIEEIEKLENEAELEEIGYLRTLGNRYTRNKNHKALKTAQEAYRLDLELDLITQERVSKTIYRLTELWLSWTQETRERFFFKYLNVSQQPQIRRPAQKTHPLFQIPTRMNKMKEKGWTARTYQAKAVQFTLDNKRTLLALEMGLGKTLIAILSFFHLKQQNKTKGFIVVSPKSAHGSWNEHFQNLTDARYQGTAGKTPEKREQIYLAFFTGQIEGLIITPQTLVNDYKYIHKITKVHGKEILLILDEAHKIKADRSKIGIVSENIAKNVDRVIGLTGTPKPNKTEDFYNIINRIEPGKLGTVQDFIKTYTYRIYNAFDSTTGRTYEAGALRANKLNDLYETLKDLLFVRTTTDPDAQIDLPKRIDLNPFLEMDPLQKEILKELPKAQAELELNSPNRQQALKGHTGQIKKYSAEGATQNAQGLGMRIEQLAISPAIFSPSFEEDYPFYETPKMKKIIDFTMDHLKQRDSGAVLFCEYTKALELMHEALIRRGMPYSLIGTYQGSTPYKKRKELERQLNEGEIKVLLANTKALETGANLQERANLVCHLSTPWGPDTLTQSTARVYRSGQKKEVYILRPIGSRLEDIKNKVLTKKIMDTRQLIGVAMEADKAILKTLEEEKYKKIIGQLFRTSAYTYNMIRELLREDLHEDKDKTKRRKSKP